MSTLDVKDSEVLYLNYTKVWTQTHQFAEINETYNISPILNPKNYLLALMRFDLPISQLPIHYGFTTSAGSIVNTNTGVQISFDTGFGAGLAAIKINSIAQLLNQFNYVCNNFFLNHNLSLIFELNESGQMKIMSESLGNGNTAWNQNWIVQLSSEMAMLLGFTPNQGLNINNNVVGDVVIFDNFDQVQSIRCEVIGIPCQSEYLSNQGRGRILTDFILMTSNGISLSPSVTNNGLTINYNIAFSESPRGILSYAPSEVRMINLRGSAPIDNVTLIFSAQCKIFDPNTNQFELVRKGIPLPYNGAVSVKLGFFSKKIIINYIFTTEANKTITQNFHNHLKKIHRII